MVTNSTFYYSRAFSRASPSVVPVLLSQKCITYGKHPYRKRLFLSKIQLPSKCKTSFLEPKLSFQIAPNVLVYSKLSTFDKLSRGKFTSMKKTHLVSDFLN